MYYEELETWEHTKVQSGLEELNECSQRGLCITKRKGPQIWEPVYWFLSTEWNEIYFPFIPLLSVFFFFFFFFLTPQERNCEPELFVEEGDSVKGDEVGVSKSMLFYK